jgi:hypothetical protein
MLSAGAALAAPFSPAAAVAALLSFVAVAMIHDVLALRVARHAGNTAPLALAAIGTLRAYARGWGMLLGLLRVARGVRGRGLPGAAR